ncbi:MAG TPA: hypothetical protein VNW99_00970 [Cytophagaceae bacterium]|jgi:hypothetical protein|nr:hypothetical protein [Cytophagaceae bacterium]
MPKSFLYINNQDDNQLPNKEVYSNLSAKTDPEMLLKVIFTLMDNNAALRKYIAIIERDQQKSV